MDLDKGNSKEGPMIATYPYRPSIASFSSDDTPLEIESGEELPTAIWEMT
jgi:hypothetical protein